MCVILIHTIVHRAIQYQIGILFGFCSVLNFQVFCPDDYKNNLPTAVFLPTPLIFRYTVVFLNYINTAIYNHSHLDCFLHV